MDQNSDSLDEILYKIQTTYTIPEFMQPVLTDALHKYAGMNTLKLDPESSNERMFADPVNKQFPIHNKCATWLSAAYFLENFKYLPADTREQIGTNLYKAGAYYGIDVEIYNLAQQKQAIVKEAAAQKEGSDDMYAIVENNNGVVTRRGLMVTPADTVKAAAWLEKYRTEFPVVTRIKAAGRILDRSKALGMLLPNQSVIEKMAMAGYSSKQSVVEHIKERAEIAQYYDKTASKLMNEFANLIYDKGLPHSREARTKIAEVIGNFDDTIAKTKGMMMRGEIPYPEDIVCSKSLDEMRKFASSHIELQSGDIYELQDLNNIPRTEFTKEFGRELAGACYTKEAFDAVKAANVLKSLPRPQAERFTKLAKENNVIAKIKTKAASAYSIFD